MMTENSPLDANDLQNRIIVEQVAEAAVRKFALDNQVSQPKSQETAMGAGVKLAGGIFATVLGGACLALAIWGVTSINDVKTTLARMEERQLILAPIEEKRFASLEDRQAALEKKVEKK